MATNTTVLAILCLAALGGNRHPDSGFIAERQKLVRIAKGETGVREATGNNDGKRVEEYLSVTGLKKGNPWCAAFVSWVYVQAGYREPRTAWSPSLFIGKVKTREAKPGNVLGIWFAEKKRIAHVGIVEQGQGDWVISIEGNTNVAGSREGDGVYRKRRHVKTIYSYADWIAKERREL